MPVSFKCPNCKRSVKASRSLIGQSGKCPYCGNKTIIPSPSQDSHMLAEAEKPQTSPVDTVPIADAVAAGIAHKFADFAIQSLGQSVLKRNIHNYNGANLAINHAFDIGNKVGLSKEQLEKLVPFPQSPSNTNVSIQANQNQPSEPQQPPPTPEPKPTPAEPAKPSTNGGWRKALPYILAGTLAGGGLTGGGVLLSNYLNKPKTIINNPDSKGNPAVGLGVE